MSVSQSPPKGFAIVGIGCMFPGAPSLERYWNNLREGLDAIGDVPKSHWRPEDYFDSNAETPDMTYARRGGFLDPVDFSPMDFGVSPRDIEATDTTQLLGLMVSKMALDDAGYGEGGRVFDRSRTGVILGITGALELVIGLGARLGHPIWRKALADAGIEGAQAQDVVDRIQDGYVPWQENSFPGLLGNVTAGRIANRLDLHGTNCVVDAACASSLSAMHMALMELETGRADMVLTGGVDTFNDIFMYMCFSKTPALSPSGEVRPFDAEGDGTILGEGIGVLAIKRLADAERDGDRIYAVVRGIGSSSDGKGNAVYAPSAEGQARALRAALKDADVDPRTIDLIEGHGTGTRVGDATEISGLEMVYGEAIADPKRCALGSVKSMIGHTKAAAGVAGMIKAALGLHHKVLPPTLKVEQPNEALGKDSALYLNRHKRPWIARAGRPRRAGVSAFGFGGSNFHAIVEEYGEQAEAPDWDGGVQLVCLSAESRADLEGRLTRFSQDVQETLAGSWDGLRLLASRSRASFDTNASCRLTLAISAPAQDKLRRDSEASDSLVAIFDFSALERGAIALIRGSADRASSPQGIYFDSRSRGVFAEVAVLFPGQGAQYPNMLLDLACQFPAMQAELARAERAFEQAAGGQSLGDRLYPAAGYSEADLRDQGEALKATEVAQVALGAVSLGAWRVLEEFGVRASATAGHSYGELVALAVARQLPPENLYAVSRIRGEAMAQGDADRGSMMAVFAPIEDVEQEIDRLQLALVVANRNAPRQVVLSGASSEIERGQLELERAGLRCTALDVSAAFHSSLVAGACLPFSKRLQDMGMGAPVGDAEPTVYSNLSAESYPDDATACRELLANQLAQPVEFVAMIQAMYRRGIRTFLEVGPGARLAGLVRRVLADEAPETELTIVSLDSSGGRSSGCLDLARFLAELAAGGYPLNLDVWDRGAGDALERRINEAKRSKFTVRLSGANHRDPHVPRPVKPQIGLPVATVSKTVMSDTKSDHLFVEAMRHSEDALAALVRVQEQTSEMHRRFLEGQEQALQTMSFLVERQQSLVASTLGTTLPVSARHEGTRGAGGRPETRQAGTQLTDTSSTKRGNRTTGIAVEVVGDPSVSRGHLSRVAAAHADESGTPQVSAGVDPSERVGDVLLSVVAEKTGYPREMLELTMGLDTDLGIDSIKRVEILSALQERLPNAPAVKPEHLGELRTLGQIVGFLVAGSSNPRTEEDISGSSPSLSGTESARAVPGKQEDETSEIAQVLLAIVAEKTGYPVEMLEPSMGLDTDLGIDSIKRVEILSALQERLPEAPVVKPEHLGELHTLGHIIDFLLAGSADGGTRAVRVDRTAQDRGDRAHSGETTAVLLAVVSEKTGYPAEMLELSMGLDADLGIDSIKRVEILASLQERLPDAPVIKPEHLGELHSLADIVAFLASGTTPPSVPVVERGGISDPCSSRKEDCASLGRSPTRFVLERVLLRPARAEVELIDDAPVWVTKSEDGLSEAIVRALAATGQRAKEIGVQINGHAPPRRLAGLIVVAPSKFAVGGEFITHAFSLIKRLAGALGTDESRERAGLLATVSRLDGAFGFHSLSFDAPGVLAVESAGLAGLCKTAALEWPNLHARALDVDGSAPDNAVLAEMIVEELRAAGPMEVGLRPSPCERTGLALRPEPFVPSTKELRPGFTKADVILVSGGARGVTAAVATALARAGNPELVLLGRTEAPGAEPEWLSSIVDEAEIKKAIVEHSVERMSPAELENSYQRHIAERQIRTTLSAIAAVGSIVSYVQVDVRDHRAVQRVVGELHAAEKIVSGIVHGAGVLADKLIADKAQEDFVRVYQTKVEGLDALLGAVDPMKLRALVLFSSSTARFGRRGQSDYAAANEVLNKTAQAFARTYAPQCRVLSFGWGPWNGGMVDASLARLFEKEGVSTIALDDGAEAVVAELTVAKGGPVELVMLGEGSAFPVDAAVHEQRLEGLPVRTPLSTVFERSLDLKNNRFLESHVMNGRPVLPVAMMMEWMAHGALHGNPGLRFLGIDDFRVLKGVVVDPEDPLSLRVCSGARERDGAHYRIEMHLVSGGENGSRIHHARAIVVLGNEAPARATGIGKLGEDPAVVGLGIQPRLLESIYGDGTKLFHGDDFRSIAELSGVGAKAITCVAPRGSWPEPQDWLEHPPRRRWVTQPLGLDTGFQLMVLWSVLERGCGSLPTGFGSYRQFQDFPKGEISVAIKLGAMGEHRAAAEIEWVSKEDGSLIAQMSEYSCVIDGSLTAAFRRNRVEKVNELRP